MNFLELQNKGNDLTGKEIDFLVKEMLDNYKHAEKEILQAIDKLYLKHLMSTDPQDIYNAVIQNDRLNKLLLEVQAIYNSYSVTAGKQIERVSSVAMSNSYYRTQYAIAWLATENARQMFTILDPRIVELSVTGTSAAWKGITKEALMKMTDKYGNITGYMPQYGSLTDLLTRERFDSLKEIQQTITGGFIRGQSNKQMAYSIRDIMGNSMYKADRIVRTEVARVANEGDQLAAIDARDQGMNIKRQWSASLDIRTRPKHGAMDGKLAEVDEPFDNGVMRPGAWPSIGDNIHERCKTVIVFVKGGEVFGPEMRQGRNPVADKDGKFRTEVFEYKSFAAWADGHGLEKNKYGEFYKK